MKRPFPSTSLRATFRSKDCHTPSTDGGASWTATNTGLPDFTVTALALDPTTPTTLYAGTRSGVFVITFSVSPTSCVGTGSSRFRGRVRAVDFTGIAEVLMTLSGSGNCQDMTTTTATGRYVFRTLGSGTYTVTPTKEGCTFTPASRTVTIEDQHASARFRGTCGNPEHTRAVSR
jgi:hypothetical protein